MSVEDPWGGASGPRVLLTDCWLQNSGDAAIAVALQRMVLRLAPGATVVHAAYGRELVGDRYPELRQVEPLDALVGTRWSAPLPGGPDVVAAADVVISQGGGFLRQGYQPWSRIDALDRAGELVDRTAVVGQTIGQFDAAHARRSLGRVLGRCRHVAVRDWPSLAAVRDLAPSGTRASLGTDLALALTTTDGGPAPLGGPVGPQPAGTEEHVGLVLSDHVVPGESPARGTVASTLLREVLEHTERDVVVWSSSQGVRGDADDDLVAEAALAELPSALRSRVRLVEGHVDAYDLLAWSTACASLVSMRFHPAVLASAAGRPAVLVMADGKTSFFDGTAMAARVFRAQDRAVLAEAARLGTAETPVSTGAALLGDALARLSVLEDALRDTLP